ncbi:MAG: hypothetical protein HQM12_05030 [SAR324 cluster bacterium]|nr:hypothetical protein [SAR324 cluster bacterium]
MAEVSKKERQEQMLRQFARIDKFLQANSKKFYQEYDTFNEFLVETRLHILEQAEHLQREHNEELTEEMRDVLSIDAEDGIANRLNMMTLILARMANPPLFNFLIQHKLNVKNIENLSFQQIPLEVDTLLFITNPLLAFDLVFDLLEFRNRHNRFVHLYITNRIARWLFRFTQFVINYDQFDKVIQLTLLQPARFDAYKDKFVKSVHFLAAEALDHILNDKKSIYVNDLRRLYLILSRTLFIAARSGQTIAPEILEMLTDLIPIMDMDPEQLKEDGFYAEYQEIHFMNPQKVFLQQFTELQKQDVDHVLVFLGSIHPVDRNQILQMVYDRTRLYPLKLFASIKKHYQQNEGVIPVYYKMVAESLRQIVDYHSVKNGGMVRKEVYEPLFFQEHLSLADHKIEAPSEELLHKPQEWLTPAQIFEAFHKAGAGDDKKILFDLASLPFCYIMIEFGRPSYHTFSLIHLFILDLQPKTYRDILGYLAGSLQMDSRELDVCLKQIKALNDFTQDLVVRNKIRRKRIKMYDSKNQLRFYDFNAALVEINDELEARYPQILFRFEYRKMLMEFLEESKRWLAIKKGQTVQALTADDMHKLLSGKEWPLVVKALKDSVIGRVYSEKYQALMDNEDKLRKELLEIHGLQQQVVDYEKLRQLATDENKEKSRISTETVKQRLAIYDVKTQSFEVMSQNPTQKEPWFVEWGRTPLRFMTPPQVNPQITIFTWFDMAVLNIDGQTRNTLISYLQNTQQLDETEVAILKQNMVQFWMLLKRLTGNIEWKQQPQLWKQNNGHVDYPLMLKLLGQIHEPLASQMPQMTEHRNDVQAHLTCLHEIQKNLIKNGASTPYGVLFTQKMMTALASSDDPTKALSVMKQSEKNAGHMKYLAYASNTPDIFRERLKIEYQINYRIVKYFQQNQD